MYLYHNRPDFMLICMSSDILSALGSTLFPVFLSHSEHNSEVNSPVEDVQSLSEDDSLIFIKSPEHPVTSKGSSLTSHPGRKFVMDFLRVIIVDSLSLPVTTKQAPVIDMLLEAAPSHSSHVQQCEFQTEVLSSLMEHLLAADVLLGEQAALPIATGGSYSYITPNVFYFTSCLVDKLWQGN
ncbi:WD repeat and FYVE domain-containing protein 3-like [Centruroides sculpturatus]|nr:WD repeat and FYVE domain-containing protein 3-like [Centruroides sculpturatus]